MRNWKIIKWTDPPEKPQKTPFTCLHCVKESMLKVSGMAIAQLGDGLVFDKEGHRMPEVIECPHCRKRREACQ